MVEPARRHGPFDTRYPTRTKLAAATWELESDGGRSERLDWSAFLARFFPTSRRHDFRAVAAYESYRKTVEQVARPASGDAPLSEAFLTWEWKGGAVAARVAD
jgi:hypothetical protein